MTSSGFTRALHYEWPNHFPWSSNEYNRLNLWASILFDNSWLSHVMKLSCNWRDSLVPPPCATKATSRHFYTLPNCNDGLDSLPSDSQGTYLPKMKGPTLIPIRTSNKQGRRIRKQPAMASLQGKKARVHGKRLIQSQRSLSSDVGEAIEINVANKSRKWKS